MPRTANFGFVGTGAITRAMVEGLSGVDDPPAVAVSPRSKRIGAELADRFPNVTVAADNQAVVDAAPVVVLATRPDVSFSVLSDLVLDPDHVVISVVAGIKVADLLSLAAPATRVGRAIPLPSTAERHGLVPVFPPQPDAVAFFRRLGDVIEVAREESFDAFSAASAYAAFQLDLLGTVESWLAGQGVATVDARRYVAVLFAGLTHAVNDDDRDFAVLGDDHATPGGLNEQIRSFLRAQGVHEQVATALDDVAARLARPAPR